MRIKHGETTVGLNTSIGQHSLAFIAAGTSLNVRTLGVPLDISIDNISVKEITTADDTPSNNNGSVYGATYTAGRTAEGLGEELVTNGGFSNGTTGWTGAGSGTATRSTTNGLNITINSAGSWVETNTMVSSLVAGTIYRVTYAVRDYSVDKPVVIYIKDSGSVFRAQSVTTLSENGTISESFTATHSGQFSIGNVGTIANGSLDKNNNTC